LAASPNGVAGCDRSVIVSIVTPTRNAIEYLDECLASIEAAARDVAPLGVTIEHVVVDADSTDGTVQRCLESGALVIGQSSDGLFNAINQGYSAATGELIGFLGGDDLLLPGGLSEIVKAYRRSGCRWIVGAVRWIDQSGASLGDIAPPPSWASAGLLATLGWNPYHHMSTYMSPALFAELGGFDTNYTVSADYDFFIRAHSMAPFARVSEPVAAFRRTGENYSVVNSDVITAEGDRIAKERSDLSASQRRTGRALMKVWINARNARWSVTKFRNG
jgi:glycosyltransferase involved in cell wall biosynthesis